MLKFGKTIPITIHPLFWLIAVAIGWINSMSILGTLIWVGIIFFSVLIHEYGHAYTAMAFGQKAKIDFVAFGGLTQRSGRKLTSWKEFLIVLNGPLAGFALCAVALVAERWVNKFYPNSLYASILSITFYVNMFWTIVNLLPVQPLDGGKLLSILLSAFFGIRGVKIALFISLVLSGLLSIFFFAMQFFIAGALFLMFTYEAYRNWKDSLAITTHDQNYILQHLFKEAEQDVYYGRKDEALDKLTRVREHAKAGVLYQLATEKIATLLGQKGQLEESYALLESLGNKISPEGLVVMQQVAYQQKQWREAIAIGDKAYQQHPNYNSAVINAICHAALGNLKPAIGWLKCAEREDAPHLREILSKQEFDAIRQEPAFQEFQKTLH